MILITLLMGGGINTAPAQNVTSSDTVSAETLCPKLALRTNLLYDAALVPNVGVEWFVDQHWSVAANVMYIWLKNDTRHRYWRLFSTDVEARYWLKANDHDWTLPQDIVDKTIAKYLQAYELLTGKPLE